MQDAGRWELDAWTGDHFISYPSYQAAASTRWQRLVNSAVRGGSVIRTGLLFLAAAVQF